jgi:hypothetical protein
LLVNVNAFTNPPTKNEPLLRLLKEGVRALKGAEGSAVPIAMKRFANLGCGYNPFWKVFFDSLVSVSSQPYFPRVESGLNVRV